MRERPALEQQFVLRRARMLARASRINLVYIAFGIGSFSAWDFWIDAAGAPRALLIRLCGVGLILLLIPLLRRGIPELKVKYVYGAAFLIACLTVGLACLQLQGGVLYGTAGIVVFPAVLAFYSIPIRFYYGCLGLALALLVPLMAWHGLEPAVLANFVIYYGLLGWVGATAARMLRRQQLRVFKLELKHAEEARTDPLTGLCNRRLILELGAREVELARRTGHPLSVGVLDLDHFKQVNDRHGHDSGDAVLRAVAQALRQALRLSDAVARFGGEEFVLLLVGSDLYEAAGAGERVLAALRQLRFPDQPQLRISASLGLAELGRNGADWDQVLRAADQALLRAKVEGRDRVVAAG